MTKRHFGTLPDGTEVDEVTIAAGDLTASIITWGAVIRDIRLAGVDNPLVLGFEQLDHYLKHSRYFGAVAGRFANRIGRGRFSIDGQQYQVSLNEKGKQHLHGGFKGFGVRVWTLVDHTPSSVHLALESADGEEGYPGNVRIDLTYTVEAPGTIRMKIEGVTDAPTLINLAQHSYFNLDASPDILDHQLRIFAESYTPTDDDSIPTGEIVAVAGSAFDFRGARPIRQVRGGERFRFDKNYVIDRAKAPQPRPMAELTSLKNGVRLEVASTEPGLQFYDGCHLTEVPVPGLDGLRYGPSSGCCLEAQLFPDAPNHSGFPSAVVRPGDTYRQTTTFTFSRN